MTQVYVPDIGSVIECAEPWTFVLYNERRNYAMAQELGFKADHNWWRSNSYGSPYGPVTLTAGTQLRVDRVYIRKGLAQYSSITFVLKDTDDPRLITVGPKGGKKMKKIRFWAKLADINAGNWNLISDPSTAAEV